MRYALFMFILCCNNHLQADENTWSERLQIHGFASQAYINTSHNNFFGDSEDGSFEFTELGLNGSFQLSPKIRLASQVLSRRAGELDNGSPYIDYALVDIDLFSTARSTTGLYLGRVKNPIGLYNQTRDVAHTREGILLPQVIYFDTIRELLISSDGLHAYHHMYLDSGTLLMQAGLGYPITNKNVEYAFMGQDWNGKVGNDRLGFFGQLRYEYNGGRWIYSLSHANVTIDFKAGPQDTIPFPSGPGLNSGEIEVDYTVLSIQYNGKKWQLTAEAALEKVEFVEISDNFSEQSGRPFGYFIQANYLFTPRWQGFIRYEEWQRDRDDWDADEAAQRSLESSQLLSSFGINQPAFPAHTNYSKSWVIGGRWDIKPNLMLRAEYHLTDGTSSLPVRENNIALSEKHWNMLAISLSYRF